MIRLRVKIRTAKSDRAYRTNIVRPDDTGGHRSDVPMEGLVHTRRSDECIYSAAVHTKTCCTFICDARVMYVADESVLQVHGPGAYSSSS